MPNITLTIGNASWTHAVSSADSTRMLNALCPPRGIAATPAALCQFEAKKLFRSLVAEAKEREQRAVAVPEIPAVES